MTEEEAVDVIAPVKDAVVEEEAVPLSELTRVLLGSALTLGEAVLVAGAAAAKGSIAWM